jgi:zinc-binding in reverse transcriptase
VKRDKVLTRLNLIKKGWSGNTKCVFCDCEESTNHLFVTCPLLQWIARYNNFYFEGPLYLWQIECCIPLKNQFVTEFIRGAVLWTIWLERNKLVFTDKKACSVTILEGKNH